MALLNKKRGSMEEVARRAERALAIVILGGSTDEEARYANAQRAKLSPKLTEARLALVNLAYTLAEADLEEDDDA